MIASSPRTLAVAALSLSAALAIVACGDQESAADHWRDRDRGPHIVSAPLAQFGCTNCHAAGDWTLLPPVGGPVPESLAAAGSLGWLEGFLGDPNAVRGRCPDVLHGLGEGARAETARDLLHWMRSLSAPAARTASVESWNPSEGERLFHTVGCVACHTDGLSGRMLALRGDLPSLTAFLADPYATRPHDWHPDSDLSEQEASWIASWLLRAQEPRIERALEPGLQVQSFALAQQPGSVADLAGLEPVQVAYSTDISVAHRTQDESFGLVFEGLLQVGEDAPAAVYTVSDDGSRMWIDGALVVDNDGNHAPQRRRGDVALAPGLHTLRVEMYEAGGGEELSAGWLVGGQEQPVAPGELWHGSLALPATGWESFVVDAERAARGAEFAGRSCLPCHRPAEAPPAPALAWSDETAGCLADAPPPAAPAFRLDEDARTFLRMAVRSARRLDGGWDSYADQPWGSAEAERAGDRAAAVMRALQCSACHSRFEEGGPAGSAMQHFTGSEDLGNEGAVPPDLTGVGAKLTREHLVRVLAGEGAVRPYMQTRMPRFAPVLVEALPADLEAADAGAFGDLLPQVPQIGGPAQGLDARAVAIDSGRTLAGAPGFACVTCHTVAGERGPAIQGMDLAVMAGRLRPEWFRRWVLDPPSIRPGTRMPAFFPNGRSTQAEILGGDAEAQVGALWTYLSLGHDMPLPKGVVPDAGAYELVPVDRPLYAGVFFEGLSARTVCVGFPERVHAAFDLHHVRLGVVWRGDFLDVAGTWDGRAGQLEAPAGPPEQVRWLPDGPAFARLATPDAGWPAAAGKEAGWRLRSHSRDALGHPTWVYAQGDLIVEETLVPFYADDGARLARRFRVTNPGEVQAALRAWVGTDMDVAVRGAALRARGEEMLVDVPAGADGMEFEVEMNW